MSDVKIISTKDAPAAIGPYVQGKVIGGFLFASGQIPLVPATGAMAEGGIAEQARQALNNVKALVEAAGSDLSKVVKTTCFLKDINDLQHSMLFMLSSSKKMLQLVHALAELIFQRAHYAKLKLLQQFSFISSYKT